MNFELFFPQDCNSASDFDEGVEFAFRLDSETTWVPIVHLAPIITNGNSIPIGDPDNLVVRGYAVESRVIPIGSSMPYSVQLCGFSNISESIQFRWLQTTFVSQFDNTFKNIAGLDNVQISYEPEDGVRIVLLEDSFDSEELKLVFHNHALYHACD